MENGWKQTTLGEVCDFRAGSVFKLKYQGSTEGDYPFIKVSDMNHPANVVRIYESSNWVSETTAREIKAKPLPEGSVAFAKIGEALRQNRLRMTVRPTIVDNNMMGAIPKNDEVDPLFLFYVMHQFDMGEIASGTALPYLTVSTLADLPLFLPPLVEQRAIAHVLGTLDDKIELNRRMNETLEAMAWALFKSWFVDYDPVRAKVEGRWRRGESMPGLPAEHYDLFPDRLVASELGEIPEGWEVKALGELAKVIYGAAFASNRFNDSGTGRPLIRIRDLATHDPRVFTDEQHPNGKLIQPGDVVVGMDGEFKAHIWQGPVSWLNQRVCYFKPRRGVPRQFLIESLKGPLANFERSKVGTTVIHLSKTDIDSIELISPPTEVFDTFASITDPIVQQIVEHAVASRTLATQRDALLPRLVSGAVPVGSWVRAPIGE